MNDKTEASGSARSCAILDPRRKGGRKKKEGRRGGRENITAWKGRKEHYNFDLHVPNTRAQEAHTEGREKKRSKPTR